LDGDAATTFRPSFREEAKRIFRLIGNRDKVKAAALFDRAGTWDHRSQGDPLQAGSKSGAVGEANRTITKRRQAREATSKP
jgi:hypothetical protein